MSPCTKSAYNLKVGRRTKSVDFSTSVGMTISKVQYMIHTVFDLHMTFI